MYLKISKNIFPVDDSIKINNFVYPDDYTVIITDDTSMVDGPYIEYYIYDDYIIEKTITVSSKSTFKDDTKCDVSKESIRNWISDKISNAIREKIYAKID